MFRDLNGDGLPDLYVCNDYFTPDRIWLNQGKGVFRAVALAGPPQDLLCCNGGRFCRYQPGRL